MTAWRLWAPRARHVELVLDPARHPRRIAASPHGDGWWSAPAPAIGDDYAISVDGGPPRPDPRSRCQPRGIHGPSRWIDTRFPWTDQGFRAPALGTGLLYELHIGTFSSAGTFDGAIPHLDELAQLGVTHVEVMPVAAFPGTRGWGYDGVDLFAVHAPYGGHDGLCRFVDACHARGLAVLLDVVYNHLGPDGNYLAELGPLFTERHHTPWGPAIDYGVDGVRQLVVDNARWWLRDCHLDGLRLDATHAIFDDSPRHILAELADEVRALEAETGRRLVLVAEHERHELAHGLDAVWFDELHHAIHAALTGERMGYYAPFGRLRDLERALVGHAGASAHGHRYVACIQNHDQVGNRALGERLGHLVSPGRLRLAAALLLTSPFVPLLFQGEEWGASTPFQYFTDHESEDLARAVVDGRRAEHAPFVRDPDRVPDPQDPATFARSCLDRGERARDPHRAIEAWYRALIALRRDRADLRDGERPRVTVDEKARTIVVRRGGVTVAGNLGDGPFRLARPPGDPRLVHPALEIDGAAAVLPPDGAAVWAS